MLELRREQGRMLTRRHDEATDARLASHLRARFPREFSDGKAEQATRIVAEARTISRRYGISHLDAIGMIADLIVMFGVTFDRDPWAHEVLSLVGVTPAERIRLLMDRLQESGVRI